MKILPPIGATALLLVAAAAQGPAPESERETPELSHGPFLGHATATSAVVWARATRPGSYRLELLPEEGASGTTVTSEATPEEDLTLKWRVDGLQAGREYGFQLLHGERRLGHPGRLRTAPKEGASRTTLAFASCANEKRFPEQAGWSRMVESGAEAIVLLGDMPYIDSTELEVQRRRYREFYSHPDVKGALSRLPFYATWDDHDFGRNDTDGRLPGKEHSRRAFVENHANPSYGEGEVGIHCSFRRGPIEVFLLDTRTFAATEPSPVDPEQPTLLGGAQWSWLKRALAASNAPFKVLASGMIWNGATRPGKTDHWMTYPHERQAIFEFIGEQRIAGVVLVGGDIHRSRALRYPTRDAVGYELTELISSPLANTVIEAANAPSPHLLHDVGQEQTFVLLSADLGGESAKLVARCLNAAGEELFAVELDLAALTPM